MVADMLSDHISFNPRAREGRDINGKLYNTETAIVSIHAPVKGATRSYQHMP